MAELRDGLSTREVEARFAELVCADDQWLRSEFDALVAACFGAPPGWPRPPAPPQMPDRSEAPAHGTWHRSCLGHSARRRRLMHRRRQRSPPLGNT